MASYGQAAMHFRTLARVGIDGGDERVEFVTPFLRTRRSGHGRQAGGDALGRTLGPLAGASDQQAVDHRLDRAKLRMDLIEEPSRPMGSSG